MKLKDKVENIYKDIQTHRRYLHQHPELSMLEFQTQQYIISLLEEHGIPYQVGATTGVVALIGQGDTCIGIRADMDALPIVEENDIPYKSVHENVMHACGHDVHMSIVLGVAFILKDMEEQLTGSVKLFFQPNEEVSSGAIDFIKEGFLENPHVDHMLGLHVMPYLSVGEIEVRNGTLTGASEYVTITVKGIPAHAAYPEKGVDAIIIASDIVLKLQTIISRNISPLESAALSMGLIEGGRKANILADRVTIKGTLRTSSIDTKYKIKTRIDELSLATAQAYGGSASTSYEEGYRPLINSEFSNNHIINNAKKMDSIHKIQHKEHPSLGVEDFGYYLEHTEGAFFHLGCGVGPLDSRNGLHTSTFTVEEECMKIGIELQLRNIFSLLNMTIE